MAPRPRALTPDRSVRDLYGSEVRRLREAEGISLVRLAEIVHASKSHLARVETAERMPPQGLSEALDAAFGTDGHFVRLYKLARREAHPGRYRRYMELEERSSAIAHYSAHMVPGLLQTEAYARALLSCQPELDDETLEEKVAARLSRQERLKGESPPYLWAILDEAVIRRPIGGLPVMRDQLGALLPQMDTTMTKIQVLPYCHGEHALLGGSLTLLTIPDEDAVAYEEGIEAGHLYEDAPVVQKYQRFYDALRAYALSPRDSAAIIREAMEDMRNADNHQNKPDQLAQE